MHDRDQELVHIALEMARDALTTVKPLSSPAPAAEIYAGLAASITAAGIGSLFAQRVLDLPPTWSPTTLATGAIVGTVAAMLAGWLSMRRQLHATVRDTLGMSTN